ncbi:biotin/lipoate A/B protein ligase family protein [Virgibacillus xinjiangensis]|uniref:Biotin/lipoate A/B protein ligase family protein n=1 Tax=Virgibacillus xinjiangensis TaxID=393090 RepID=A0ABV7CZD1_9BACI
MEKEWAYLDSGIQDAAINMALDESLLKWHSKGEIPPTLRFYGWSKPSLSLGRFQKSSTIDLDAVHRHNCHFVRRLTGGSAVLHDNELTYSLVINEQDPSIPTSVQEAYHVLSQGVLEGYKNIGIAADFSVPEKKRDRERTSICFEKPAFYEMVVDGKKISGNAQTRKDGVVLQHGSIPISMNTGMLFDLFRFSSEKHRERKRKAFAGKAADIAQLTGKQLSYEEMTSAFKKGFEDGLGIHLHPFTLSEEQWEEVHQLAETKYSSEAWTHNTSKERVNNGEASRVHT